jgi:hypothetical protein
MTELLCLKTGCGNYVRTTGDSCELTPMSKATVFTIAQKTQITELLDRLRCAGMDVYCVKLTITEEQCAL